MFRIYQFGKIISYTQKRCASKGFLPARSFLDYHLTHIYIHPEAKQSFLFYKVVENPGISVVGYSQPDRFFPLYAKLKERKDGAVDRLLLYQPKPHRLTSSETKEYIRQLHDSSVKDLRWGINSMSSEFLNIKHAVWM